MNSVDVPPKPTRLSAPNESKFDPSEIKFLQLQNQIETLTAAIKSSKNNSNTASNETNNDDESEQEEFGFGCNKNNHAYFIFSFQSNSLFKVTQKEFTSIYKAEIKKHFVGYPAEVFGFYERKDPAFMRKIKSKCFIDR